MSAVSEVNEALEDTSLALKPVALRHAERLDALEAENERLRKENDTLRALLGADGAMLQEADKEIERLRMQLAACGVVAMANTPESAAKVRDMHADYKSASCDDVARAVDREMALRAELATARNDALVLENAIDELLEVAALRGDDDLPHPSNDPLTWTARMQTAWDDLKALREGGGT